MSHDALRKSIIIPDLPHSPHVWRTPNADMLYGDDHPIDPLANELKREEWLSREIDSNPLLATEMDMDEAKQDVEETRYGSKLGSFTVGLNEGEESGEGGERDRYESDDYESKRE